MKALAVWLLFINVLAAALAYLALSGDAVTMFRIYFVLATVTGLPTAIYAQTKSDPAAVKAQQDQI